MFFEQINKEDKKHYVTELLTKQMSGVDMSSVC